mgnify:CR=1 FL=1|jgi:hypothetical protein
MKIPKKVKIGGVYYPITQVENLYQDFNAWGRVDISTQQIYLQMNTPVSPISDGRMQQSLVHEIVHVMLDDVGHRELSKDEDFVERFSNILYQVIEDNKL